ncbi:MAG: AGE family epimerase/isomerase [Verrucomicrobiota bacterium]|jgi:mannobiose 2-epimerase
MNSQETQSFSQRVSDQLFVHLMPFWCGPALDREQGGWMACLSNDLKPDRTQPKGLIVNSRILWAFSAVHRKRPDPLFKQMADRAFDFVISRFWDAQFGGAFWQLDDTGRVIDDSKKIYGQAFYIYALAEYHQAFHAPPAMARAIELFESIERHAHDPRFGGYLEVRRRDWSETGADARLSDKDMNEKKSMNNHLHVLEAYTNLYRVWKDPRLEQRLRELIGLFEKRILDPRTHHFNHFFDEQWRVRSDTYTFGHDVEGAWLLCEAAEVLGDPVLLGAARMLAVSMAATALREGVAADGGLYYEGKGGTIIDPRKECWPQAEAVIAFLHAFQVSGDSKYLDASIRAYDFIEDRIVDRVHGDWFWRINEDGRPDPKLPKVSEWKGPYHGSRMCLETLRRLHTMQS